MIVADRVVVVAAAVLAAPDPVNDNDNDGLHPTNNGRHAILYIFLEKKKNQRKDDHMTTTLTAGSAGKVWVLRPSSLSTKKYVIRAPDGHSVHFGARGYSDYPTHRDTERKKNYLRRHGAAATGERWGVNGMLTAGFWSRWVLWNLPTIRASVRDIERRFHIRIRIESGAAASLH